jgi:hypothetical protein
MVNDFGERPQRRQEVSAAFVFGPLLEFSESNLQRAETMQNRWIHLGTWDLPTQLTVVTSSAAGQTARTMTLSQHRLLNADKKAAEKR